MSRIVLAAISPFLSALLSGQPEHLGEVTLLLPQVRRSVLAILLEFLYTGTMQVSGYLFYAGVGGVQGCGSAFLFLRIRIQLFFLNADPDPATLKCGSGSSYFKMQIRIQLYKKNNGTL